MSQGGDMACTHSGPDSLAPTGILGKVFCVDCHEKIDCPHPPGECRPMKTTGWQCCGLCARVLPDTKVFVFANAS